VNLRKDDEVRLAMMTRSAWSVETCLRLFRFQVSTFIRRTPALSKSSDLNFNPAMVARSPLVGSLSALTEQTSFEGGRGHAVGLYVPLR
jgi:hypothetical protein